MSKQCKNCGSIKNFEEFSKSKSKKDGLQPFCKACMKVYLKSRYTATKEHFIDTVTKRKIALRREFAEYKSTLKCETCPESHPAALDFHHRDGREKDLALSAAVHRGWSMERIKAEIAKCAVLCSNCHRKLHYEENERSG